MSQKWDRGFESPPLRIHNHCLPQPLMLRAIAEGGLFIVSSTGTKAATERPSAFTSAAGGSLFLDCICDLAGYCRFRVDRGNTVLLEPKLFDRTRRRLMSVRGSDWTIRGCPFTPVRSFRCRQIPGGTCCCQCLAHQMAHALSKTGCTTKRRSSGFRDGTNLPLGDIDGPEGCRTSPPSVWADTTFLAAEPRRSGHGVA